MLELAATFCTLMGVCRDVSLIYDSAELSIMTCMVASQPELAKWTDGHPGFYVKRWSCGTSGRYAKA